MKSKKRFFAWLLTLCMVMTLVSNQYMVVAHAEEGTEGTVYTVSEALALENITSIPIDGASVSVIDTSDVLKIKFPYSTLDEFGNTVDDVADRMSYKITLPAKSVVELTAAYVGEEATYDNGISCIRIYYSLYGGFSNKTIWISNYTDTEESWFNKIGKEILINEADVAQDYLITVDKDDYIGNVMLKAISIPVYDLFDTPELPSTVSIPADGTIVTADAATPVYYLDPWYDYSIEDIAYSVSQAGLYKITVPARSTLKLNAKYTGELAISDDKIAYSIVAYGLEGGGICGVTEQDCWVYNYVEDFRSTEGDVVLYNYKDTDLIYIVAVYKEHCISDIELSVSAVECWVEIDGKEYYLNENGEVVKDDWVLIDGKRYYLDENGEKGTGGWLLKDGAWYYLDEDGAMKIESWIFDGANWYYIEKSGIMVTGWVYVENAWYYMNPSGAMATGWVLDGATWYYMNPSGAMATGWVLDGATWYYMNPSGAMATGWVLDGATWYYMNPSGAMATGWVLDGATWYYMYSSGAMATGWVLDGSNWYFMYSSGAMAHDTVIGGFKLNSSGAWVK